MKGECLLNVLSMSHVCVFMVTSDNLYLEGKLVYFFYSTQMSPFVITAPWSQLDA